jgi:putative transposase
VGLLDYFPRYFQYIDCASTKINPGGDAMYGTIQVKLNIDDATRDYLIYQCRQSNSLTNSTIYQIKQAHFEDCPRNKYFRGDEYRSGFKLQRVRTANYAELCLMMKDNLHYQALGGQAAQQTLKTVAESFKSYNGLLSAFFQGEVDLPRMPGYRTKGGLAAISYPAQAVSFDLETGQCRLPVSLETKADLVDAIDAKSIWINGCVGIHPDQIAEVRILPRNGELYAEYVYQSKPRLATGLDFAKALGIDPGLENWLTCVTNDGESFILDGRKLKSMNQRYNKRVAEIKRGKAQGYWDDQLADLTEKRNRTLRDAINKTARFIVNRCLERHIGHVVFGWGQGVKQEINLGSRNNQNFVQIPTARLKNRIKQLCEEVGINFVETEESYTSKTSFLDGDFLPTLGAKPESWKPSGKRGQRIKGKMFNLGRGGYQTAHGARINSDCNGAANILRKVAKQLDICLAKIGKGALNLPKRYDIFKGLKTSYRQRCVREASALHSVCLQTT